MAARALRLALVTILVLSTLPMPTSAGPPMADAGLDQTVTKGATVHLDATGSQDPDGTITSYRWRIETPTGDTTGPDCETCGTTTFVADTVGTYDVRVTVTDDGGETASDTLYVHVRPGEPPALTLTGPTELRPGQTGSYTAEMSSGDAPLDSLTWFVDGTPVRTIDVDGTAATETLEYNFPTAGHYDITARVTDTDDQTDAGTIQTGVQALDYGRLPGDPGGARGTATIHGPRTLTGDPPFEATYTVTGSHIAAVTWWKDGFKFADGDTATASLRPGDHFIHARVTYTDGTTGIGRFSDGTTRVVVDPRPRINTRTLTGLGGLNVTSIARDDYGNLQRFELRLDGTVIFVRQPDLLELRKADHGARLEIDSKDTTIDPGRYTATLIATDARGQINRTTQQVEVVGPPKIVRAEFVTDRELDVYHPRIDPERYTARYEVEIDLNGVPSDEVATEWSTDGLVKQVENDVCTPSREVSEGRLKITKCLANPELKSADFYTDVYWERTGDLIGSPSESVKTTPSDPEIRVHLSSGGAERRGENWGIVVNVSESFDPDGTPLVYNWDEGAEAENSDGTLAKFDNYQKGVLIVTDQNGGISILSKDFTKRVNPEVGGVVEQSRGPYLPGESITFVIRTIPYELPKGNYREDIQLGLRLNSPGRVTDHHVNYGERSGDTVNQSDEYGLYSTTQNYDQQFWTVQIPGNAFFTGTPTFVSYNKHNPEISSREIEFPEPKVLTKGDLRATGVQIEAQYLVLKPVYTRRSTVYENRVKELQTQGFEVVNSEETGTEWEFESRKKVSSAIYETKNMSFSSRGRRSTFLDLNDKWMAAGSEKFVQRKKQEITEWRDDHTGKGRYTGRNREVQIIPNRYRTEHQYRYAYTTTERRKRIVTKTFQYIDRVSFTDTVEKCNQFIGCYESTVTRTRWVTRTRTKQVQKYYSVEVREYSTYWAESKYHHSHKYTGRTRRELVQPARYETQFEYAYTKTLETMDTRFLARQTIQVQPAQYKWVHYRSTKSQLVAEELRATAGIRLAGTNSVTEWSLRKQSGTDTRSYSNYDNVGEVEETRVNVSGTVVTPYLDPTTGSESRVVREEFTYNFSRSGQLDDETIIEIYLAQWKEVESE